MACGLSGQETPLLANLSGDTSQRLSPHSSCMELDWLVGLKPQRKRVSGSLGHLLCAGSGRELLPCAEMLSRLSKGGCSCAQPPGRHGKAGGSYSALLGILTRTRAPQRPQYIDFRPTGPCWDGPPLAGAAPLRWVLQVRCSPCASLLLVQLVRQMHLQRPRQDTDRIRGQRGAAAEQKPDPRSPSSHTPDHMPWALGKRPRSSHLHQGRNPNPSLKQSIKARVYGVGAVAPSSVCLAVGSPSPPRAPRSRLPSLSVRAACSQQGREPRAEHAQPREPSQAHVPTPGQGSAQGSCRDRANAVTERTCPMQRAGRQRRGETSSPLGSTAGAPVTAGLPTEGAVN